MFELFSLVICLRSSHLFTILFFSAPQILHSSMVNYELSIGIPSFDIELPIF